MIDDAVIRAAEGAAQEIGFGTREDYPFLSGSAISAGDWKGDSIITCVFYDSSHAGMWLARCIDSMEVADGPKTEVYPIETVAGGMAFIAVITATDMFEKGT